MKIRDNRKNSSKCKNCAYFYNDEYCLERKAYTDDIQTVECDNFIKKSIIKLRYNNRDRI